MLAQTTMSVRQIQKELREKVRHGVVGEIVKRARQQGKAVVQTQKVATK